MKLYLDYKKRFNILFNFLVILVILLILPYAVSFAETAEELQTRINQSNSDIDKLEAEIAAYQREIEDIGKQKSSLSGSIKELDLTRKKLSADISLTEKKIEKTNLKIGSLSSDINTKQSSISNNTSAVVLFIKQTNEFEDKSLVENVLSSENFSDVWHDIDNMITVREKIRDEIKELKQVKVELEDTRKETIDAKNELVSLKSKLSDQKKIVEQNTKEKNKLLAETKNSEANYQKLLKDQLAKKLALEQEVRDYESKLKFILDPSSLPSGRVLSWPLDYIYMTSPYGPRGGGFHAGTDFRAAVGTPVKAIYDGVVLGTGNTDLACPKASFGQWVFIEHSNGLSSTYAHLSLIKAHVGDRVNRGTVVGYSGNTGSSTGPHLHLALYASKDSEGKPGVKVDTLPSKSCLGKILTQPIAATNAYLDPMNYLPPYTKPK